jgi:plasmid stabilization system protein ParE
MYKISYRPRAEKELEEALEWYENRSKDLGKRFLKEVQKKLKVIQKQPDYYAVRQDHFREAKVKDFPYHVIYRIDESLKVIVVSSIFHTKRNPTSKY